MPDLRHAIEPEEIMAYLDGELPSARAAEAMNHLEHCAECKKLAADLKRVSQDLTSWQVMAPRDLAPPAGEAKRLLGIRLRRPIYVTVAFAGLAAMVLVAIVSPHSWREAAPPTQVMSDSGLTADVPRSAAPSPPQAGPVAAQAVVPEALPSGPMIERTASLDIATRDFDRIRSRIDAILASRRGYIGELTSNRPSQSGRTLTGTLRVPAAELDATLIDLRQLGRVQSESQKGDDVTRQYADLVARLANARNTEQRLTEILRQRTGKLADVLEVERELARVRGEIEQMEAERRLTADQVAFATIRLTVSEEFHAQLQLSPDSTLTRLRNAAIDGYKNLAGTLIEMLMACIRYGPTILLWLGIAFLAARLFLRRRKSAVEDQQ